MTAAVPLETLTWGIRDSVCQKNRSLYLAVSQVASHKHKCNEDAFSHHGSICSCSLTTTTSKSH